MKKLNCLIIILLFALKPTYSQRGQERSTQLSFSRNNNSQSNKNGFDFTGLKFGYQFANCGGNVIVGINYAKNVMFTNYWFNGKSYGKDIIGEDLWPKPSDVEVNTVKADLYYGSQNLGKVTLNYIVGNFTGCFGETYDVLSQVRLSSSDKKYKDNINNLSLANIQIVNARAIGVWRDGKISERLQQLNKQKEAEKINEQVYALLQSVDYRILAGNYEAAKELLEKAYKLKPSQEIKNKINETNELIKKKANDESLKNKTNEAYTLLNNGNYDLALSKFKEVYATNPSNQIKEQIDYISKKIEEKKKEGISDNTYANKNKEERKNSDYKVTAKTTTKTTKTNNSYSTTSNTYNPNLSKEANDAINYAINKQNYEEQRKLNEQRRLYEQRRQEQLKEEKEYQNQLNRERRKRIEEDRRRREYIKNQEALLEQKKINQDELYRSKGGDANFNKQLNIFLSEAQNEINQINSYLNKYKVNSVRLTVDDNCSYVSIIDSIQNAEEIPISIKSILISNVIRLRVYYYQTYKLYSKTGKNEYMGTEECANYLDFLYQHTFGDEKPVSNVRLGGNKFVQNNKYDTRELAEGNYTIPIGMHTKRSSFAQELSNNKVTVQTNYLNFFLTNNTLWNQFHKKPKKWSDGYYFNYNNEYLLYKKEDIISEINKYKTFYNIQRKYNLATNQTEIMMAFFNYHTGDYKSAINHYKVAIIQKYGSFNKYLDKIKETKYDSYFGESIGNQTDLTGFESQIKCILLGAILFFENNEFEKSLDLLNELYQKNKSTTDKTDQISINAAYFKLRNQIFYSLKQYDKMVLETEESIKNLDAWVKNNLKYQEPFIRKSSKADYKKQVIAEFKTKHANEQREYLDYIDRPILASVYLKKGDKNLAKKIIDETVKFYSKDGEKYVGTKLEIDAFKEVLNEIYPKNKDKIEFVELTGYSLEDMIFKRKGLYVKRKLTRNKLLTPNYLNTNNISLVNNQKWLALKEKTLDNMYNITVLDTSFKDLYTIYNSGKLQKEEESKLFLEKLIDFGIVLNKHYEILPIYLELQDYNDFQYSVFSKISVIAIEPTFRYPFNKEVFEWFKKNNSESVKKQIEEYVAHQSKFKTSNHASALLYSLFEIDNITDKTTYKETQKQTDTKTSYKETNPTKDKENELGRLLVEARKQYDEGNKTYSRKIYQQALQLKPNNPTIYFNIYFNIGLISQQLNDYNAAKYNYQQALKINPNYNKDAYLNLAIVILAGEQAIVDEMNKNRANFNKYDELEKQQKKLFREALPYLKKYWELDKRNTQVNETLKNIYESLGMKKELIELKN